jgi:hypothetical protein
MPSFRADLALLGLAVVGVLSELACVLTGHPAPGLFQEVTLAGVAGAAGVALPAGRPTPDPAPAPAPVAAVEAPVAAPGPAVYSPTAPR